MTRGDAYLERLRVLAAVGVPAAVRLAALVFGPGRVEELPAEPRPFPPPVATPAASDPFFPPLPTVYIRTRRTRPKRDALTERIAQHLRACQAPLGATRIAHALGVKQGAVYWRLTSNFQFQRDSADRQLWRLQETV